MENKVGVFSKSIGRGDFALRYIPTAIIAFFAYGGVSQSDITPFAGMILITAALYALLVSTQRLNDLEMPKWYLFLTLVPLVNLVFGMILLTRKGKTK